MTILYCVTLKNQGCQYKQKYSSWSLPVIDIQAKSIISYQGNAYRCLLHAGNICIILSLQSLKLGSDGHLVLCLDTHIWVVIEINHKNFFEKVFQAKLQLLDWLTTYRNGQHVYLVMLTLLTDKKRRDESRYQSVLSVWQGFGIIIQIYS